MDSPAERAQAQTYWRQQLQLTALAGIAFVLVLGATRLVLGPWGRDPGHRTIVVIALATASILLVGVIVLLVRHAVRVAAFTFRRGDSRNVRS